MKSFFDSWKKYLVFSGRTGRGEFWKAFLCYFLIVIISVGMLFYFISIPKESPGAIFASIFFAIFPIYILASLPPIISLEIRRLHDADFCGWWILLVLIPTFGVLILLILLSLKGTSGENKYGPNPKVAVVTPSAPPVTQ